MKNLGSKEVINMLKERGWCFVRAKGSHHTFIKEGVPYHITVPHPDKDLAKGTLNKILKLM
ncbi:type II toxin-antitoxin system HicA family toxin [Pantoea stewartii]|uniref:type II toxin-antitoxin system HicA family toxin n=1 Tax=Enterobacterales TaxID=91347 RepID=UPI00115EA26E|nr:MULTISPECIES: type II toxin-antitoxin system HicA family toxin [Enterobacterales]MDF7784643.1 type II toxin-antitoxin system HicA family toxin [Pantoea stewartii]MDM2754097.1 type II toxin-antitoxin system HicA family toxin [Citrobacter sp. Cpo221]TRL67568.1 type II toxin-antitoxin system HicA family toxin [Citrobacter youngae]